jgi:hypothetical protein
MVTGVPEGNSSQLSRIMPVINLSNQVEFIENFSAFERCLWLDRMFFQVCAS